MGKKQCGNADMDEDRPNILVMFTDSQRFDTISALGNPIIKTPNLDRIACEGTAFTNHYSPSPICIPARACMLYGQYAPHTGCYDNSCPTAPAGRQSFVGALTDMGYRTHGIGKCHFSPDPHAMRGFQSRERQEEVVNSPDEDEYLRFLHDNGFAHICDPHGVRGETMCLPQQAQMPAHLHPTNWVGDRTVDFIENADEGQPWYLFSSFINPHPGWAPPCPWHKLYRPTYMPAPMVPPGYENLWTWANRDERRAVFHDQGVDWHLLRACRAYYYACVSFVDYQVGRILKALQQRGELDSTLIMFTSDHGDLLGDYLSFHLGSYQEGCCHIPLLARFPGTFQRDTRCSTPTSLVDIAPTILNIARCDPLPDQDGLDLAEITAKKNDREMVFSQFRRAESGIYIAVTEHCKYAYSAGDDREFLFDRTQDPLETRNVADMPLTEAAQQTMKRALIEHLRTMGETSALDGDDWQRFPNWTPPVSPIVGQRVYDHPWADLSIPGYTDI